MNYILNQTKDLVKKEKHYTVLILQNIKHIEEHKLFAKLGYSSLYKYLIGELKYSEGEANIRVANVKLMKKSQIACEQILNGELSLTNGKDLFRALEQARDVNEEKVCEAIAKIKNKSTREAQGLIAQFFEIEAPKEERIVLRGEVLDKLNRLKKKYQVDGTLELIEILFERDLKEVFAKANVRKDAEANVKKDMKDNVKKDIKVNVKKDAEVNVKKDVETKPKKSRYISVKVKAATIARAQWQCEYVGASGRRCCSKRHLQFEHVKPFTKGGNNGEENIRFYCRAHNQLTAMEIFGQNKVHNHDWV